MRSRVLFLCCLLMVSWIVSAQEEEKFILENPSFETEASDGFPTGWKGNRDYYSSDTKEARTGNASLRWKDTANGYFFCTQKTRLKSGDFAAYSVWVKTKDLKNGSPQICMEWKNKAGEIGGSYNASYLTGTVNQWTKIGGVVFIPEDVEDITIICFVSDGATGTVWFDDVLLKEPDLPLFSAITTNCYRQQIIAEPVKIHVGITPLSKKIDTRALDAVLTITDSNKKTVCTLKPTQYLSDSLLYELNAKNLSPGQYCAVCSAQHPSTGKKEQIQLQLTRWDKLPDAPCRIDRKQRLILNGVPFFPLGIYALDVSDQDAELLAQAGFNTVLPYNPPTRENLDRLYARNLHVIYSIGNKITGGKQNGKAETVDKAIAPLKDHPAIIAWYINDEMPLTRLPEIIYRRSIMEKVDSGRPTYTVLCQVNEIRFYVPSFDVIGTDPYPVPNHPVAMAAQWTKKTRQGSFESHAVWQVPQLFNWAAHRRDPKQKKNYRAPHFDEMRAMAWMSIAQGANGLMFYSLHSLHRMDKLMDQGGEALVREPFMERWKDIEPMIKEISEWIPVLLWDESPLHIQTLPEHSSEIVFRSYASKKETWLLIVNTSKDTQTAQFLLPKKARLQETKMGPQAQQKDNTISVVLPGLQPAFLHIIH